MHDRYEKSGGSPYIVGHIEKRRRYDEKRPIICAKIFEFYEANVGPLTITTHPVTSKRSGKLVRFVMAVVECITEPATPLNDQAIREELKDFLDRKSEDKTRRGE